MTARIRQLVLLLASTLLLGVLSGCGTINEKMSDAMGGYIPQWAGGLPADAPPRPGTAKYDEFMAERERLRQMPAADRPGAQPPSQSQAQQNPPQQGQAQPAQARSTSTELDPVH